MKYILLNDMSYIKKKLSLKIICYFIIIMCSYIVLSITTGEKSINNFYDALGINFNENMSIIEKMLYIFNILFYIYITLVIFSKELKSGIENLFLRVSPKKYIILKSISLFIISFIINATAYLILIFYLYIDNLSFGIFNTIFLKNIVYIYILQNLIIIIYVLFKSNIKKMLLFLIFIMLLINFIGVNIINSNLIKMVLTLIILYSILIISFIKNYFNVFEK